MNRHGATPLHVAVANGQVEIVRALINAGAKTDTKDRVSAAEESYS
jgi:ankyrin repeat protein